MAFNASDKLSPRQVEHQVAELRKMLGQTTDRLRRAEERASIAEQSARDAWRFAKGLLSTSRRAD